jgi:ATP-binding cassette subfamily C (CFTR/MRP) protein 1
MLKENKDIVFIFLKKYFIASMRQLRRLSSITKSPIFSHFNESVSGSLIIRAFKAQKNFIKSMDKKMDENLRFYNADLISNRFFSVYIINI